MTGFTGGCLCGAIRYEVNSEPVRVNQCHCDNCRKATGASFATNVFFKADALVITKGATKSYQHKSDSGNIMTKEFCADCGSQLIGSGSGSPDMKHVKVGSIDDASFVVPQFELFMSKALPFTKHSDVTKKFDKMPTG